MAPVQLTALRRMAADGAGMCRKSAAISSGAAAWDDVDDLDI